MKILLIALGTCLIGTIVLTKSSQQMEAQTSPKTVRYTALNGPAYSDLKMKLAQKLSEIPADDKILIDKNWMNSISTDLDSLKRPSSVTVDFHTPQSSISFFPIYVLWSSMSLFLFMFWLTDSKQTFRKKPKKYMIRAANQATAHLLSKENFNLTNSNQDEAKEDLNRTIVDLAVGVGHFFQASGKFLDVNLKDGISECFVEKERLEIMCREFILSCHQVMKDREDLSGMYLRTDEQGSHYIIGCFIPGLTAADISDGSLSKEFLNRFAMLEARFAAYSPTIDMRLHQEEQLKGIDFILIFENRSKMESQLNSAQAIM
jgi:hypothetical protein